MQVIFGINRIKKFKKAQVALGVFDGVHLAHRRILIAARNQARRVGGRSIAFTFWPHPHKEESIYSLKHRLRIIGALGIDACIVARLSKHLSRMSPEDFVRDVLVNRLGVRHLYVGRNFRFGNLARGDVRLLSRLADAHLFRLKVFEVLNIGGSPVSSTGIRRLITLGKLDEAGRLLGRPVGIMGTVVKGGRIAQKMGFPTANINPHHEVIPPEGIYAVRVLFNKERLYGACYIGRRPTFGVKAAKHIEVHIFDFSRNLYGKDLQVEFIKKIRKEKKFASTRYLARQIKKDILSIKKMLPLH